MSTYGSNVGGHVIKRRLLQPRTKSVATNDHNAVEAVVVMTTDCLIQRGGSIDGVNSVPLVSLVVRLLRDDTQPSMLLSPTYLVAGLMLQANVSHRRMCMVL